MAAGLLPTVPSWIIFLDFTNRRQPLRPPTVPAAPRAHAPSKHHAPRPTRLVLALWAVLAALAQPGLAHSANVANAANVANSADAANAADADSGAANTPPLQLQPSTRLSATPSGEQARQRPMLLSADSVVLRPDIDAVAQGKVEFRRAGTVVRADRFSYDSAEDLAIGRGQVSISRDGARYSGPELQLQVQRFEGFFLQPSFEFFKLGAGGRADRVDFLDTDRLRAERALYTSCPRDDGTQPDWLLRTDRLQLDFAANVGVAEGAVLQFLGVPILGLPKLSFPINDERKSGWLPPTVVPLDNRNGFTLAVPYYWNIAPNRDATLIPTLLTRRGLLLDSEFRYLEAAHMGRLRLVFLPQDRITGGSRHAWDIDTEGRMPGQVDYRSQIRRVSDDAYWKDFPRAMPGSSSVPRLLGQNFSAERGIETAIGSLTAYARVQHWQVLQTGSGSDLITAPYQRSPQLGLRLAPVLPLGLQAGAETEVNRFTRPVDGVSLGSAALPAGWRWHGLGQLSRPFSIPGGWITPKLLLNAAAYAVDAASGNPASHAQRIIPTASLDAGVVLERRMQWFGRSQRQTLEPRLLYVNTPYRNQAALPNFDSAERDFNALSIFTENAFTGVDRVSDAHQLTTGLTTRLMDSQTGAETLRLTFAQRLRLSDQQVVLRGDALTQRLSDVLVEGATSMFNPWKLDAALQYNPDTQRITRSILGLRYAPAPFHTLSARYRLAKGLSEQVELGWQWPVYRGTARPVGAAGGCGGTLYAVGRLNYSLKDSRATDSTVGVEYDTGCWIARVVAERLSTGRSEAATRLLLQLELVGLSRLGANPLQVLKDNIPGYRLLREPGNALIPTFEP